MTIRKEEFVNDEYYHIFNQSVEKKNIFLDDYDIKRFLLSLEEFNSTESSGGIYEKSLQNKREIRPRLPVSRLINLVAYCINPNHFHLIVKQKGNNGISTLMNKLGGYSKYFNHKYKRRGTLFQGRFKAKHIDNNEYLLHLSAYVNLNDKVHSLDLPEPKLVERSSWREYTDDKINGICDKKIIIDQFDQTRGTYKNFAEETLSSIVERKNELAKLEEMILEEY